MEQGCTGCSAGTAAHGWRALTFPPAPFRSPAGGEEGGGRSLTFPLAPFLSPAGDEEGGGRCLPFPLAPSPLRSSLGVLVPAPTIH